MADYSDKTWQIVSIVTYSLSSAAMLVLNKLCALHYNQVFWISSCQMLFSVCFCALLVICKFPYGDFKASDMNGMIMYTFGFAVNIYSSNKCLQTENIETVLSFRCCASVFVLLVDSRMQNVRISPQALLSVLLMMGGALSYVLAENKGQIALVLSHNYTWPCIYTGSVVYSMIQGKSVSSSSNLNLLGMVLVSNALALSPMLAGAFMTREQMPGEKSWVAHLAIASSCAVGTAISFSGWWCRRQISATTYSVVGNMNKIATLLANIMIWKYHATPWGVCSLLISLTGGLVHDLPVRFLQAHTHRFARGVVVVIFCIVFWRMLLFSVGKVNSVAELSRLYNSRHNSTMRSVDNHSFPVQMLFRGNNVKNQSSGRGGPAPSTPLENATAQNQLQRVKHVLSKNTAGVRGAVVILAGARHDIWGLPSPWNGVACPRFCCLLHAVQSVDSRLNMRWGPYPIIVITANDSCTPSFQTLLDGNCSDGPSREEYTQQDKDLIRSWAPHSAVSFVSMELYSGAALEPGLEIKQFDRWNSNLDGGIGGKPIGYRAMCRLYSGRLQNHGMLRDFQYYMRLDDDSFFTSDLSFDPFVKMKTMKLQYAYRRQAQDSWGIKRMWELALPYMNAESLRNMRQMGMISGPEYTGAQPYNNFHVASVEMFQRPTWQRYMRDTERAFGFFKYRFGDANVHAIAMGMLLQPKEVDVWNNLPYAHNVNDLDSYPPSNWNAECKSHATKS